MSDNLDNLRLGELFDYVRPGYKWLLRQCDAGEPGAYFCHIHSSTRGTDGLFLDSVKVYDESAEEAFRRALRQQGFLTPTYGG